MNTVQVTHLGKPSSHRLHNLFTVLKTLSPLLLPFKKTTRKYIIGTKLENTSKCMWLGCATPEVEFLHQFRFSRPQQRAQFIKIFEVLGSGMNHILSVMKALESLVFPYMSCLVRMKSFKFDDSTYCRYPYLRLVFSSFQPN